MDSTISIKSTLPLNYKPHSNEFIFEEDKLTFNSKFDSGNLLNVTREEPFVVIFYIKNFIYYD
jgi:hypothetical protein